MGNSKPQGKGGSGAGWREPPYRMSRLQQECPLAEIGSRWNHLFNDI
jgi:hypothetical protein